MSDHTISPTAEQSRVCTRCGEAKPITDFAISSMTRNGKTWYARRRVCRTCKNIEKAAWRRRMAKTRQHVEVSEKRCQRCREVLPISAFGVARREVDGLQGHCNACRKAYREANKGRILARVLQWQRDNTDKVLARGKRYYHKHIEASRLRGRINVNRRRTRKAMAGGDFSKAEWQALCEKYQYRCLACGQPKPLAADHVVPISLGGTSHIENIQPLCQSCNSRKGNKTLDYRPLWRG